MISWVYVHLRECIAAVSVAALKGKESNASRVMIYRWVCLAKSSSVLQVELVAQESGLMDVSQCCQILQEK